MTKWFSRWLSKAAPQNAEQIMLAFAKTGKPAMLEALVKCHGNDLYHYLLSHSDPTLAADISQSTWLKVMEKRQYYKDTGSFKSWLFTLGRNQMLDQMRHANRWQTLDIDGNDALSQSLDSQMAANRELERFNQILARLPFLQKEAFILQQEGFSLGQIAQITGENQETIKSRIRYAKNTFKQLLEQTQKEVS